MVKLLKRELARKEVLSFLGNLDTDSVYRVRDLLDQYGDDAVLSFEYEYDYCCCDECCSCDRYMTIKVQSSRLETDDEYDCRINAIKARRERKGA